MKTIKTIAAGIIAAGLFAVPASAATFDFTGLETNPDTPLFDAGVVDGIGLEVSAGVFTTGPDAVGDDNSLVTFPDGGPFSVPADGEGIGVSDTVDTSSDVDGFGDNDILIFTFDQNVEFGTITFENVDANDDFFLIGIDPITAAITRLTASLFTDINGTGGDTGSNTVGPFVGSIFGLGAVGGADNFLVSSVTVAAVPLPAAAPLLATGFLGLGLLARRRRKKS